MNLKKGSWPGGPRRRDEHPEDREKPRLDSVEEITERQVAARRSRKEEARRRTAIRFAVLAALAAAVAGYVLGDLSRTSTEELVAERERQRVETRQNDLGQMMQDQSSRVIQQMWLSEIIERQERR